jgi:choline dehydrogenase-like flavoprotein
MIIPYEGGHAYVPDAYDDALAQVIAASPAVYGHPTSMAPMGGPGDPWAVDSVGTVKGVSGLRVADASVIPEVPLPPPTSPSSC